MAILAFIASLTRKGASLQNIMCKLACESNIGGMIKIDSLYTKRPGLSGTRQRQLCGANSDVIYADIPSIACARKDCDAPEPQPRFLTTAGLYSWWSDNLSAR
jgi:hypothetical protein